MKTKIITFFASICIIFALNACSQAPWLYHVNVQQGNVITPDIMNQLHLGMTKEGVCDLLGPPVLIDAFNDNRWTYTFTFKPGRGKFVEKNLILYFRNNRLCGINKKNV